jgi:hypothetical protein
MKSNNLLVAQRKSISTKIQATDAKTWFAIKITKGKSRWSKLGMKYY